MNTSEHEQTNITKNVNYKKNWGFFLLHYNRNIELEWTYDTFNQIIVTVALWMADVLVVLVMFKISLWMQAKVKILNSSVGTYKSFKP